jgi:very-short-patch-repair endonuclease
MLDGQVFSHVTALALWGAPIRRGRDGSLHLSVTFPRSPPRLVGAIGHSLRRTDPSGRFGVAVSTAAAAWCESAGLLDRVELVAAGDALVTGARVAGVRTTPVATIADLRAALAKRPGSPGAGRALWALERIRVGVDSFAETQLRLLLVRHRLAEPTTDCPIVVAEGLVLHSDLGYPAAKIAIEYEGDQHRTDRKRWMRDIRRRELMEDAGWRVVRVTQADLDDPAALVARLRRLLVARQR